MIRKKLMKTTSYMLIAAMCLSLFAGCDKKENTQPTQPTQTTVEETTKPEETKPEETKAPDTEDDAKKEQARFDEFNNQIILDMLGNSYYSMSDRMENPKNFGLSVSDFDDYTLASFVPNTDYSEMKKLNDAWKETLESFDYEKLTKKQQLTYDKLVYELDITERSFGLKLYASPLNTMSGIMSNLGIALYNFQFDDIDDVESYYKMLNTIPQMLSEIPTYIQFQIDEYGYYPSDNMIDSAIGYSSELRKLENNPLLDAYDEKIDKMDFSDEKKEGFKNKNRDYVVNTLFSEFEKFEKEIKKFDTDTNETKGLANYDGGKEYYDYQIKGSMGLEWDLQKMLDTLNERLQKDLDLYMETYETGSFLFSVYLSGNYNLPYDKTDVTDICEYYTKAMAEDFPMYLLPEYDIQNLPKALQIDGLCAYYVQGEFDDTGKKIIRVNPNETGESADLDMTLIHEGVAGHMLQFACAENNNANVDFMFSELGYTEGWAMYAEIQSLNYAGINKKIATWKKIDSMYGYYLQAIVDIGVNGLGWDHDKTAGFLAAYNITDSDAIDSIMAAVIEAPGSIVPYALGYLVTDNLMEEYKALAKDDVNLKEMHEKYMSIGNSSFDVVSKYFFEGLK